MLLPVLLLGCVATQESISERFVQHLKNVQDTSIAFISDTQAPIWLERLWLKSDNNENATQFLINKIAVDSTCVALFHLGDITAMGSFGSYWEEFEEKSKPIRDAAIPFFPAFGNHEYMPFSYSGKRQFLIRFPFMVDSWYQQRIGSLAVIILNSNFSELSEEEQLRQRQWYEQALKKLDEDVLISSVLVGCHHSPYTNSTIVNPSEEVQKMFVPSFLKSKKGKLFLSGHSHAFEHFQIEGKDFLVLGGGGGLLHPLLPGNKERWHDTIKHEGDRSNFHYVKIIPTNGSIVVNVLNANSDYSSVDTIHTFKILTGYN